MKKHRLIPGIVAGLLSVGGISAMTERGEKKEGMVQPENESPKEIHKQESGPESDSKFCAEHPIEAELRTKNVSPESVKEAMSSAAEFVRSHRFHDEKNEEKYFAACRDAERWDGIQKSIHFASEKTGVPERVLIAMGLIESQFHESAQREDTGVFGPYQMTLATAQEAAKDAQASFGFPIDVKTGKDLQETKTAVRLAALRLKSLKQKYGQLGLAIADYAGGRVGLEKKISEHFPEVDFGKKEWDDMQRHHKAEQEAKKKRDILLLQMKRGPLSTAGKQALKMAVQTMESAGMAYQKSKQGWKQKRDQLPQSLADAGVNILSLYQKEQAHKDEVPHSITYALTLDDLAERADRHAKEGKMPVLASGDERLKDR